MAHLHKRAAVFVSWALPGLVAALVSEGCVMAAMAAKFCTVIGGSKPAAAAAAVAAAVSAVFVWAPKPVKQRKYFHFIFTLCTTTK